MKNILVTGGAGFIGSHTIVELIGAGYNPIVIDNFANSKPVVMDNLEKLTSRRIALYEGDFGDQNLVKDILVNEDISGVIHFAAYKAVGESVNKPLTYYQNNVAGLINLLNVIEKSDITSLVFSSSCTVYGEAIKLPITEDEPLKPAQSPYGATKQMDEVIIRDTTYASKVLRSLSLRYFNPIGAHKSALIGELPIGTPANLVPYITQTAAGLRDKLTVYGDDYETTDGTCVRDYIHVVDLAKAHVAALKHLENQEHSYYNACNIGTGVGSTVLEVIHAFEKVTKQKLSYTVGPRRQGDVMSAYAATNRAQDMLGWKAELSLDDALLAAWKWQQRLVINK